MSIVRGPQRSTTPPAERAFGFEAKSEQRARGERRLDQRGHVEEIGLIAFAPGRRAIDRRERDQSHAGGGDKALDRCNERGGDVADIAP